MNKHKKIALKLWKLPEDDKQWLLGQLADYDAGEIKTYLHELGQISQTADKKVINTLFSKYLSYSKQEMDLLNQIDSASYSQDYKQLVKNCLLVDGQYNAAKKTKIQLIKMANQTDQS